MRLKIIAAALLTGSATIIASFGIAIPAQAIVSTGTAYIIEGDGIYKIVNNTAFYAFEFIVSNPAAAHGGTSSTTQTGWSSLSCTGSCLGLITGFHYFDDTLADDIAPGQSSSNFFFNATPASNYIILLRDKVGNSAGSFSGTAQIAPVPEPATWALMMVGLGAAGTMLRRRRSNSVGGVAA